MSQAVVELDDEALDQVSGGLKRLDSDWKPEITEVCKLCGSTRNVRGGLCLACKNKCLTAKEKDKFKTVLCFHEKNKDRRSKAGCK